VACLAALIAVAGASSSDDARALREYRSLLAIVDRGALEARLQQIAGFGSRIAGSDGERRALEFAKKEFQRLGLKNVREERFEVTVPDPEAKGTLALAGRKPVEVYPLWPNLVRTSTCDVEGTLVYGGKGSLEELSGKRIEGSLVVLEFDSGGAWRDAARLGARAVLFLEPRTADRSDAEAKFAATPLSAPRFWVPIRSAGPLLAAAFRGDTARLRCRQDWVERESANVLAELPGTDSSVASQMILVSAYADSISAVPGLAPGAESSSGLAALLELARIAARQPGRRPMMFLAGGAHHMGLQGAREFVARRLSQDRMPLLLAVSLDLSTGSASLGSFSQGWYYEYRQEAWEVVRNVSRVLRSHAERMAAVADAPSPRFVLADAVNDSDGRTWKNSIPSKFAHDCEPFLQARYNALTFATVEDARSRLDTPFDTVDKVDASNLARQVWTIACLLWHVRNDTSRRGSISPHRVPLEVSTPRRMSLVGGFAAVEGRVVEFDPLQSFLPDVSVEGAIVVAGHGQKTLRGVRGPLVTIARGGQASYRFDGIAPANSWFHAQQRPLRLSAFRLEPESGNITAAPSLGLLESWLYTPEFLLKESFKSTPIVVFPCVATDLYGLTDPHDLKPLSTFRVLDADTDAEPTYFGFYMADEDPRLSSALEDSAVLFAKSDARWKLLMGSQVGDTRLLLSNADAERPYGRGYGATRGPPSGAGKSAGPTATGQLRGTAVSAAKDLITLNEHRHRRFARYRIVSPSVNAILRKSREELEAAQRAESLLDWAAAERHARTAWGYALRAHPFLKGTADDVVLGVLFYLFLLIPFSYFFERLLFASRSLVRQLAISTFVFFGAFLVLRLIHPAFEIVSNPTMIFVAFLMGALSLIVTSFVVGKFESSLKALQALKRGIREVDIGRFSVAMAAFGLGISNMRRRKARTFLTTLTLVVMTFIVLGFTSIVPELKVFEVPSGAPARYPGILVRNPGLEPIQETGYRMLRNHFGADAAVVFRAWYYGSEIRETGALTLQRADKSFEVRALLGLEPDERRVAGAHSALDKGGRWFQAGDDAVAILPRSLADQLGVDDSELGNAKFSLAGEQFTVIGIADDSRLKSLIDLDGDGILPADFALSGRFQTETRSQTDAFRKFLRLDPGVCVLLPARKALKMGAEIHSIGIGFGNPEQARRALDELMPRMRLNLYAGLQGDRGLEVRMFSVQRGSRSAGMALVIVQMLIAGVFVLNTMIASVYERTKEIGIFSAVGLAPNHIAVLFLAEAAVYGVIGAVIGYFLAQGAAKLALATGALPGLYLNFSATSAVFAALAVMAVILFSAIYPAKVAARIAAPALDEELMSEEPEGDQWEATLPFSLSEPEALALLGFLCDWMRAYEEYTIGEFVTSGTELSSGGSSPSLRSTVWLAPYDLGVSQTVRLDVSESGTADVCKMVLNIERLSGDPANWALVNRRFLGRLRRQFLTWRALDEPERMRVSDSARGSALATPSAPAEAGPGPAAP